MTSKKASLSTKAFTVAVALAGGALLTADFADARGGKGGSFGSRGSRTQDAPAATRTAPNPSPVQKSITQPGRSAGTAAASQASRGGMMRNLLLGGLIGAGLASLFGLGGGFAAMMGFLLQMLLIGGIVFLVIAFFRSRSAARQPALAQATSGAARGPEPQNVYRTAAGGGVGVAAPTVDIVGADYDAFERLLKEVQLAYANSDIDALGQRVTPEVLSEFARDLDENKKRGLSNDLSEPRLLQGDLAESWREASGEYATVAMRYEIVDALVEQRTGRVVEGSTTQPQEVTELWTFYRPVGGTAAQWELSAIQQA